MCGRYGVDLSLLPPAWGEWGPPLVWRSCNVAPGRRVPVLVAGRPAEATHPSRQLLTLRWGLIPPWWRQARPPAATFNARAETITSRPMFRQAFRHHRCIVPAQYFYEWGPGAPGDRQPFLIRRQDGHTLALAGLFSPAGALPGEPPGSCTILTCAANALIAPLHDRMPVVLDPEDLDTWLTGNPERASRLLVPAARGVLTGYPVDRRVGNVRNDDPSLTVPVGPTLTEPA
jgi:putative SOS response-associated peptidase YedK